MKKLLARWKSSKLLNDGLRKVVKGDFDAAIITFSKAIEAQPDMLDGYLYRGTAYIDIDQYQRALDDLNYVVQRDPENHLAYYNRSIAWMALGEKDLALTDLNRAIELSPEDAGYYLFRSIVLSDKEEYVLALEDTAKAIEFGESKMGHNNRAVILEKKGDISSAIVEWTKVLEIEPTNVIAYAKRGLLRAIKEERKTATEDLRYALKHKEDLPESLRWQVEKTFQEPKEGL